MIAERNCWREVFAGYPLDLATWCFHWKKSLPLHRKNDPFNTESSPSVWKVDAFSVTVYCSSVNLSNCVSTRRCPKNVPKAVCSKVGDGRAAVRTHADCAEWSEWNFRWFPIPCPVLLLERHSRMTWNRESSSSGNRRKYGYLEVTGQYRWGWTIGQFTVEELIIMGI